MTKDEEIASLRKTLDYWQKKANAMKPTPAQIEAAAKTLMRHPAIFFNDDNAPETNLDLWLPVAEAALSAAAKVGPQGKGPWVSSECWNSERNATIERCAQVAEQYSTGPWHAIQIAAAIRKLKDE